MTRPGMRVRTEDAIIVGSGIGGLACALSLAPKSVTVITKTARLEGGSSVWAQGGIAAAIGPGDSPAAHAADTVTAGAGLSDAAQAQHLTEAGAAAIDWLIEAGVPFDRDAGGALQLGKEAAHGFARIVHAGGDATGYVLMQSLIARVRETPSIDVLEDTFACDLVVHESRICGVVTFSAAEGWVLHQAPVVVIATGGIGMAWWHTTNPREATGDGLAMAARAGARLADLEFMQFHPTALAVESGNAGASLPLLTEALRGAGALLLDAGGERFMPGVHPDAELAPRDIVARAIFERTSAGESVFLDISPALAGERSNAFPTAVRFARQAGFDPFEEPLPVTPAAHYHMGGIAIDQRGRTSLAGLWACGEAASTGIHGANRLASNSLLEALVFARDIAADIQATALHTLAHATVPTPRIPARPHRDRIEAIVAAARDLMTQHVGILRDGAGLAAAGSGLQALGRELDELPGESDEQTGAGVRSFAEARNLVLVGRLVALGALQRTESRGAHCRRDFPQPVPAWRHSQSLTIGNLAAAD